MRYFSTFEGLQRASRSKQHAVGLQNSTIAAYPCASKKPQALILQTVIAGKVAARARALEIEQENVKGTAGAPACPPGSIT